jgi:phosphoglycolate phosphatase-like HAD superfamily hydrolase
MTVTQSPWLVLFDIDGTLVHTLGAGVRAMNRAFNLIHGRGDALDRVPIAGRPDRAIVTEALAGIGVEPTDERILAIADGYFAELPAELRRVSGDGSGVLPGVVPLLDWMDARPDFETGLLTGNFETGAAIKLAHFDLWRRFRFGAFGDAHLSRRDLVPVAMARAREAGVDVPISRVIVIGDTPLDVDCAHAHGALAIGVATGTYTTDDLARAGANLVLSSLEECDAAGAWVQALEGGTGQPADRR